MTCSNVICKWLPLLVVNLILPSLFAVYVQVGTLKNKSQETNSSIHFINLIHCMSPKQNKVGPFPTPYSIIIIATTNVY